MATTLHYLDFDYSEDGEGTGTWDAMASAAPPHQGALQAEVARVLDWAHHRFAGQRGPIEDGADWDYDLQGVQEVVTPQQWHYDEATRTLSVQPDGASSSRQVLNLSLSGTAAFGAALRAEFGLDA